MSFSRSARASHRNAKRFQPHRSALPRLETLEDRTVLSGGLAGNLVVFGDSLDDVGNVFLATGGTFPDPSIYSQGRFSNGPIWVETLAKYVGVPAVGPSLAGGLDYAFGGATVAATDPSIPSVAEQVGLYLSGHTPAANDLVAVWAGANDFFDTVGSPAGPISPLESADTLAASLDTLAAAGARRFVVANLPPLGATPFLQGLGVPGLTDAADQWAAAFDARLGDDLAAFASGHAGATVVGVDLPGLFQQMIQPSNPFGFVNRTDPVGPLVPGVELLAAVTATDPQDYLFFDGIHPTSKTHQIVGLQAAADVYDALGVHHLVVTSTADTVDPAASGLSLREMVNLSNTMQGGQTITFNLGSGSHQIKLGGKDLPIRQDLAVYGPDKGLLTISGEGKSRIFEVSAGVHAVLSDLTIIHGASDAGGAVSNAGTLSVEDAAFLFNTAQQGGAIYNTGSLRLENSVLTLNTAAGGSLNAGGALANAGPSARASLSFSAVLDNTARGGALAEGGGIANLGGAELNIAFGLIAGNTAAGVEAWGGGIFDDAGSGVDLSFSALTGNAADGDARSVGHGLGGGMYLARGARVAMNSTVIVSNSASTQGRNVYQAK